MKYIESKSIDPFYNLAFEEYVFNSLPKDENYFMLWQNQKAIVIGRYQNTIEEINKEYTEQNGIKVVRRLSGGGAVYHDLGNLNYTFIVDREIDFDFNFKYFVVPVIETLKCFGITGEFTGRNDLTISGGKFCGNAQYISNNRILHHGCIMLDTDLSVLSQALKVNKLKMESKSTKSVRSRVTTISEHALSPISMNDFKNVLLQNVSKSNKIETYNLSDSDEREIEALALKKYSTREWNYGASPEYTISNEIRTNAGTVSAKILVEKDTIKTVKFYGDFFGNGNISELEEKVGGTKVGASLAGRISDEEVDYYINGFTLNSLTELLYKNM